MFSQTKFKIGRIFGGPLNVDISLLLIAGMFVVSSSRGASSLLGALVAGLLGAAALAVALLVHEVGHAAVAMSFGCRVHEITLMFFGGYAAISNLPSAPLRRAGISFAGPGAGLVLWWLAPRLALFSPFPVLVVFLYEVARFSLYLSVFNLIPAVPLDGGHILRDVIAHFKGIPFARMVSYRVSKIVAIAMGLYGILHGRLMLILIAFFIWASAKNDLARGGASGDDPDNLDDDVVVISPPPYGKDKEYTRIRRP